MPQCKTKSGCTCLSFFFTVTQQCKLTGSELSWSPCSDYSEWKAQGVEWVVTVV